MIVAVGATGQREAHLLRGVLDMCVLAVLTSEPTHAYEVVERLRAKGFETVGYGSVYPLVTRLRRQGLLSQETRPSPTGPPRHVLSVTPLGEQSLVEWRDRWQRVTATVSDVVSELGEGIDEGRVSS